MSDILLAAAEEYLYRKWSDWNSDRWLPHNKRRHPDGSTPRRPVWNHTTRRYGGWYWKPSEHEWQKCCDEFRDVYTLRTHCRTAKHVALLFGVSRLELLRTARQLAAVLALEDL